MTLTALIEASGVVPVEVRGDADLFALVMDSRKVTAGALFVCMPGLNTDSQTFLPDAALNGAKAAVVYSAEGMELALRNGLAALRLNPEDYREAIWRLCRTFFDSPSRGMKVVGVTGTNGKTTTAWLMRDMFNALGLRSAYLGTLGFYLPNEQRELPNTTPFAIELYNLFAEARDKGVQALAIEVSSHALEERRTDGIEFDAAVFTNLTQDHLDFHGTMSAYADAKWRLFSEIPAQSKKTFSAAFNQDDRTGAEWAQRFSGRPIRFGTSPEADLDLALTPHRVGVDRITADIGSRLSGLFDTRGDVEVRLGGKYNVQNCASAAAGVLALGYSIEEIATVLPQVHPVPGRFEPVHSESGIGVIVDYAHTPDALEKLLDSVRELDPRRIITVFGCGGDRDRTKRPLMAKSASERSDLTIVTSDNPRTEDPELILEEVRSGIASNRNSIALLDREEAIQYAVKVAEPGDVVVIAGKGHENYQIIGKTKYPMDDRLIARDALESR